tara:strand:- start:361 stop:528 length:168 start_codon:yes stop_codon:yes gene_type:complete
MSTSFKSSGVPMNAIAIAVKSRAIAKTTTDPRSSRINVATPAEVIGWLLAKGSLE